MKTVTDIPYGKKALTISAAAGKGEGHVVCADVLQIASQCDRLPSGSSTGLACAISPSPKTFFTIYVPVTRTEEHVCCGQVLHFET